MVPVNRAMTCHLTCETNGCFNKHGYVQHRDNQQPWLDSSWNNLDLFAQNSLSNQHFPPDRRKYVRTNCRPTSMSNRNSTNHPSASCLEKPELSKPASRKRLREAGGAGLDLRMPYPPPHTGPLTERASEESFKASAHVFKWERGSMGTPAMPPLVLASETGDGSEGEEGEEEEEEKGWCQMTSIKEGRRCAVCGDSANGNFFGATVCLPCKSFFIRWTKEGVLGIQKQCEGRCDVKKDLRHRCQYCRFQRCLKIGMKRKEKPEVVVAGEGQTLCRVCGDLANGIHFGVSTCEGCKKFFLWSLQEHRSYVCGADGGCSLNPRNRNHCRRCRYLKCKVVGMSRDAIKMGRPRKCGSSSKTSTSWQRTASHSRVTAPSFTDPNLGHPAPPTSSRPPLPQAVPQDQEHPLPVSKDAQVHGRRGLGKRVLTKNGCVPWFVAYQKRWFCPHKLGVRKNGLHDSKKRSHVSLVFKPGPSAPPLRESAPSVDYPERRSFPASSSLPETTVRLATSRLVHGHVHSTSLDDTAAVTHNAFSPSVGVSVTRDSACVRTYSRVVPHSGSIRRESLQPVIPSTNGSFSSLNPNSGPKDTSDHHVSPTNADVFVTSHHASSTRNHAHTAGLENTRCKLCIPPQEHARENSPPNSLLNNQSQLSSSSETASHFELSGCKTQYTTTSVERLPSDESRPWGAMSSAHRYNHEGLDLCLKKPTQRPSPFTKQASNENQHQDEIGQQRFIDSRAQSLNSTVTEPFPGKSVSGSNTNTAGRFFDRNPLDLSCPGRLRQSPSGPEHGLQLEGVSTTRGSQPRTVESAERAVSKAETLISHYHCQGHNDGRCNQQRVHLPDPAPSQHSHSSSPHHWPLTQRDRGPGERRFRPQNKVCTCQTYPQPAPGETPQPVEAPVPCRITHKEPSPSCPAPAVDTGSGDGVIRTLLDLNGQDLEKITGVISGLITLLELIQDRKEISSSPPSGLAK
ncbi:hypothetical protein ACOMHN_042615 [Nucella lapillus]